MRLIVTLIISFFLLTACSTNSQKEKSTIVGIYRGALLIDSNGKEIPFQFEIKKQDEKYVFEIINGDERIVADETTVLNDSLFVKTPVFDAEFKCLIKNDTLLGTWTNFARKEKNKFDFIGIKNKERFGIKNTQTNIPTKWSAIFSKASEDEFPAIGEFSIKENKLIGTFLTETGDYRYLEGIATDSVFLLSCFDGSHAFLFEGTFIRKDSLSGTFYSGKHWQEPWSAVPDENFKLRNPDSITFLKPGFEKISFSFKDENGKLVTDKDEKFKNKVVIIQVMGTWCPNCMDETALLAEYYSKYKNEGLEIIALAFEKTIDFNKAANNINRLKKRFGANYTFLITEKTGKDQASEALPMLNKIISFPTSIFIDKKGNIRKIYTGFSGPGTGNHYLHFKEETSLFIEKLLKE